ncbi:DUF3105 domain-containing protein [Salsipaludibacter albus]|uniref:DUF3105 domain-containing protein n=1 Tax=Salsipaludibacter albus TaxID=2849650 RepID=UPI001EE49665|nr:DUF3105 domain-containing protein [Salsipaludibacter albus]MBY5163389.1 DUF3105 domain-containing protein [Salsipaludibacter albus]
MTARRRPGRLRGLVAAPLVVVVVACGGGDEPAAAPTTADAQDAGQATATGPIEGVEEFTDLAQDHTEEDVDYPQNPPVGGPHAPAWQNCGVYDTEIADENGVHSLEHGAVWITHDPGLDEAQVNALRARAAVDTHVLVSPRADLPSPVVASAWGVQVQLDGPDDERLDRFVAEYAQGPQTPEPGAACAGGIGEPLT